MITIDQNERHRRVRIAMIPFGIAAVGVLVACVVLFLLPLSKEATAICVGVVGAILAFDLPVCVLVLVQWIWTGDPPELSLVPLVATREERALRKTLRTRPKLAGDEFYRRYYAESSIPKPLVAGVRALLEYQLGLPNDSIEPSDNLIDAFPELDWRYLMEEIEVEFRMTIPLEAVYRLEGTFDSLLRVVAPYYKEAK